MYSITCLIPQRGRIGAHEPAPMVLAPLITPRLPILPCPQPTHSLTTDPSNLASDIIFLTSQPKTRLITRAPHHQIFQSKNLPNHPSGVYSNFPREIPSDDLSSHQFTHPNKNPLKCPIKCLFKNPPTEPTTAHPTYTPSYQLTNIPSTCPVPTPFHTWAIPGQLWQPHGHILLFIESESHLWVQSQKQLFIQSCTGSQNIFLPSQLT